MYDQGPKYWNTKEGRIVYGVELSTAPLSLETLCGTYSWVYNGDREAEEEVTDDQQVELQSGFLRLELPPGKEALRSNFTGSVEIWNNKGHFHGLKEVRYSYGERDIIKNYWDIESLEWDSDPDDEGQAFCATEAVDDDGNPFIEFVWDWGYSGCAPMITTYIAKKRQNEDEWEGLTDSERDRLGINMNAKDVKALTERGGSTIER